MHIEIPDSTFTALSSGKRDDRRYVLALLILVGAFAWIDRQVFAIVLQAIKSEFSLSDTRLGMIGGAAFGIFYVAVGLPVAWLADRFSRRNIIAASIGIWSVMTALCGCTSGFWSLFFARMGVGIGEGGAAPASQSVVADLFPEERRGMALGLLYSYVPVGYLISFALGGWVNDALGWRMAFLIFGLPGAALALLVRLTLREPPRVISARSAKPIANRAPGFWKTLEFFLRRPTLRHLPLAGAIHAIGMVGASVWMPAYFMRTHAMSSTQIGLWLSLILGVAGLIGTLTGGQIADRLARRYGDARWYPRVCAICLYCTVPFTIAVYLSPGARLALILFIVPTICNHMVLGPSLAAVQNIAGVSRRAMAAAFYLFVVNLISMGVGPTLIGSLSDYLHPRFGNEALRYSLMGLVAVASFWSATHYLLAARTIRSDLPEPRE